MTAAPGWKWRAINNEKVVEAVDGHEYIIRVARAGVYRYSPIGGFPNLVAVVSTWLRYLVRREDAWVVEVRPGGLVKFPPIVDERFASYEAAACFADQLAIVATRAQPPARDDDSDAPR
jgi:hypothetical protein